MDERTHTLKTREQTVQSILAVRGQNGNKQSWDKVAEYFDVSKPCVWRLVHEPDYNPGEENCEKLGMVHYKRVQACPNCGEVHTKKTCPRTRNGKPQHYTVSVGYVPDEATRARLRALSPAERLEKLLR